VSSRLDLTIRIDQRVVSSFQDATVSRQQFGGSSRGGTESAAGRGTATAAGNAPFPSRTRNQSNYNSLLSSDRISSFKTLKQYSKSATSY
jgi:hypothetical protein